jgi:hypothetical protein
MKRISILIIIAVAVLSSGFSDKGVWLIDSKSRLVIYGYTNVNNFTCKIASSSGTDTLQYVRNDTTCETLFSRNQMSIPIRSFDCGPRQISKDFHKTLKSETYPALLINFRSLRNFSVTDNSSIPGVIDITLAGVTAQYTVRFCLKIKNNDTIILTGMHQVNFSDFKLKAPEKLSGLIKVQEALDVEFNLVLKNL